MAELDTIIETLRRQKRELDDSLESASSRSVDTTTLMNKLDELRRRSERSQRVFEAQTGESGSANQK